jgi:hypothetical protein
MIQASVRVVIDSHEEILKLNDRRRMNSHIDSQLFVCPYMYDAVVRLGTYLMYAWEIFHGFPRTKNHRGTCTCSTCSLITSQERAKFLTPTITSWK